MIDEVMVSVEGHMGVIRLNRPKAINALTLEMIDAIYATLVGWANDAAIAAVLLEGEGERGFCAGGDVRQVRQWVLAGEQALAERFFVHEYRLNGLIAGYRKPIVALTHGAVMGGGIGLAGHAGIRIAADNAKYAMPEAAIGLMCDVGVNAILAKVPAHRALAFEMAGLPVGPGDALALGLVDYVVEAAETGAVRGRLIAAAADGSAALRGVAETVAIADLAAPQCELADAMLLCFAGGSAAEVVAAIARMGQAGGAVGDFAAVLAERCPTSLEAIIQNYRAARLDPSIENVLKRDLKLATWLAWRPDFAEGVRAVLVDKDNPAVWNTSVSGVLAAEIAQFLK